MEKIFLAGIDLDGTLLRNDKSLSQASVDAINRAVDRGITVVPITGRPLSGVPDFIKKLDALKYIVTSNGAYITDIEKNEIIYSKQLSFDKTLKYISLANSSGLYCEAFSEGYGYVDSNTMSRHRAELYGTPLWEYITSSRCVVENVYSHFEENRLCADEIFCIAKSQSQRENFRSLIENDDDIQYCELENIYIELTHCDVDKGRALKRLCTFLNIPIENTIAFGDGENDLSFMKAAGTSVAMKNAKPLIIENADIITETNENDGVAKILDTL